MIIKDHYSLITKEKEFGAILEHKHPLKILNITNGNDGDLKYSLRSRTYDEKVLRGALDYIAGNSLGFKKLDYFSESPIVKNGEMLSHKGYCGESRVFITNHNINRRSGEPKYLQRILSGFPFKNNASKSNFIALMISSAFYLEEYKGKHPAAIIAGDGPDLGKSLLSKILYICTSSKLPTTMSFTENDEELEKRLISKAMSENSIIIDNIRPNGNRKIESAVLERFLTDERLSTRLLGHQKNLEVDNTKQFILTINDGSFSEDIITRSIPVELSSEKQVVEEFEFDPVSMMKEYREQVLGELLNIVLTHQEKCKGEFKKIKHGKFPVWGRVIGGIVDYFGFEDFMANLDSFRTEKDGDLLQILLICCELLGHSKRIKLKPSQIAVNIDGITAQSVGRKLTKVDGRSIEVEYGECTKKISITKVKSNDGGNNSLYEVAID